MSISSTKNPQIKYLKQLQSKSKLRLQDDCFVVEGIREMSMAVKFGYSFTKVYTVAELFNDSIVFNADTQVIPITKQVYEHLAYRSSTEGVIGICKWPDLKLDRFQFKNEQALVLVLESPEKPGNIGAILRTADAAKADAVIIADAKTDLYNPNTIRSSLGAIFSIPLLQDNSEKVYNFLKTKGFQCFAASLQNSNSYLAENYRDKTAFIMGCEAQGLSDFWRNQPEIKAINIPMRGEVDSMNLSVSTAILTFEALRQRSLKL
jgi:RNA methyltransferase, TrmH family